MTEFGAAIARARAQGARARDTLARAFSRGLQAEALAETLAMLSGPSAAADVRARWYWPKWNSPWWRMLLLHELGLSARVPRTIADALASAIDAGCLHFFPLRQEEIPPGTDTWRQVACHCQVGTVVQVLGACGVNPRERLPWIREWFARYQLADGGWNCDEAAYTRPNPGSSFVSTTATAEGALVFGCRDEARRGASYLTARKLARSLSKNKIADASWLKPCFPRFYDYDVLRGLRLLARLGEPVERSDIGEAVLAVDAALADPARPPYWSFDGIGSYGLQADGTWAREPVTGFPLLDVARSAEVGGAALRVEWAETAAALSEISN